MGDLLGSLVQGSQKQTILCVIWGGMLQYLCRNEKHVETRIRISFSNETRDMLVALGAP
jgi:hypothetical protein